MLRSFIAATLACIVGTGVTASALGRTNDRAVLGPGESLSVRSSSDCGDPRDDVRCLRVSVPLDWSRVRPGKLSLRVEEYVSPKPRGVMFLLAGGPGQASTEFFYLGRGGFWQRTFPGYTLVAFDPRGTGGSTRLHCRPPGGSVADVSQIFAACAKQLGTARDYYRTVDNAMDIDAVRRALGFERIGLYGASYGTDLAVTYARMFPTRAQRLVLDSVAAPFNSPTLVSAIVKAIPETLRVMCAHACVGGTRHYALDAISLANAIARKPLRGRVLQVDGKRQFEQLDASEFLNLLVESDLNPGFAAELPAAVEAARTGHPAALLRLQEFLQPQGASRAIDPVYMATVCDDGPFPWQPDTPVAARPALLSSALARLPRGSYGQFGSWAAGLSADSACTDWPATSLTTSPIPTVYPNIPVLAVAGDLDLRAPTFEARAVLAHFPRGQLLTVPNTGHAPLADLSSGCLSAAVRQWLSGRRSPRTCPTALALPPLPPFAAVPEPKPVQALALVTDTLHEAEAAWQLTPDGGHAAGLQAGVLIDRDSGFELSGYELAGGVALSGQLAASTDSSPWRFAGVIRINGRGGMVGSLALNGNGLTGNLDGELVVAGRLAGAELPSGASRPSHWADWTPPAGSTGTVASAIARRVASTYLLDRSGKQLLAVTSAPADSSREKLGRPLSAIAVRGRFDPGDLGDYHLFETSNTWTYSMCGAGPDCSIATGTPTRARFRLVAREGLELALYTFRFDPGVGSVVIYFPPPQGYDFDTRVFYYVRSDLTHELSEPLARTLPLTVPPLPSAPDAAEGSRIDRLTLPRLFAYSVTRLSDGTSELTLSPDAYG